MLLCRTHLKKLVCQVANHGLRSFERPLFFSQWFGVVGPQPWKSGIRLHCSALQDSGGQPTKKKKESRDRKPPVLGNVGRLIPHKVIQVISENGENMGIMNKNKVIQMMDENDLRLVALKEYADPPVYKLMTGKQLFEEQTKLREKQKLSTASSIQVKEISFLASIQKHDLDVKKKQLTQWIEKKHHVQITISDTRATDSKKNVLEEILSFLKNQAICLSKPKERKDGRAIKCTIRPLSQTELQKLKKESQIEPSTLKEPEQSPNPENTSP